MISGQKDSRNYSSRKSFCLVSLRLCVRQFFGLAADKSMSRRLQFSLANVLLAVTCCALALASFATFRWKQLELWRLRHTNESLQAQLKEDTRKPIGGQIRQSPITVAATLSGDFIDDFGWSFSMNSAGEAQVTKYSLTPVNLNFQLTNTQMSEFRQALITEKFFELDSKYGEDDFHAGIVTISISVGSISKTVKFSNFGNSTGYEQAIARDADRAIRILKLIQSWFPASSATGSMSQPRAP